MTININKSLGFVILNSESNHTALRTTMRTIKDNYPECPSICVLGKKAELEENSQFTNTIMGGETITSLIDTGIEACKRDWCMVIQAGTFLRPNSLRKYCYFHRGDRDILYPVVDRKYAFDEASINGLLIPKIAMKEVGRFGDHNHSIQLVKMLWAIKAIDLNYKFKAIVGARLV